MNTITLGKEYKDKVTGFKGIAVSRIEYFTGCTQVQIQPQGLDKDKNVKKSEFFDIDKLVEVGKGVLIEVKTPGGPGPRNLPKFQRP